MFNEMAWSFIVQTLSGVVAVFIGIWLALVVERRRRAEDANEREVLQQLRAACQLKRGGRVTFPICATEADS